MGFFDDVASGIGGIGNFVGDTVTEVIHIPGQALNVVGGLGNKIIDRTFNTIDSVARPIGGIFGGIGEIPDLIKYGIIASIIGGVIYLVVESRK